VRQLPESDNHPTRRSARRCGTNNRQQPVGGGEAWTAVSNLLANEAPLRCTKWRSMSRASNASSCFVGRAAAGRCSNGGATISVGPKPVKTSATAASGAPSATRPTSSLSGRGRWPRAPEEHDHNSGRGTNADQDGSLHSHCPVAAGLCNSPESICPRHPQPNLYFCSRHLHRSCALRRSWRAQPRAMPMP
jgi:hypothetical protein